MRRLAPVLVLLLSGCLFGPPSPSGSPSQAEPTATPSASGATPSGQPSSSPTPTPGVGDIPVFLAGDTVASTADGLRIRSRPGTDQLVLVAYLPVGTQMVVLLGPVVVDGFGWYLLKDTDPDEPEFDEGWIAAGFQPEPFLVPASFELTDNPVLGGFAHDGGGQFGPVRVEDANVAIRWIAAPAEGRGGCSFGVDLTPGSGAPVPAIRATVGGVVAPGDLYGTFFAEHPELVGDIFVSVTSDCSWALSFVVTTPPA
jgi:hypothetical protein